VPESAGKPRFRCDAIALSRLDHTFFEEALMAIAVSPPIPTRRSQVGRFFLHYAEMCAPMCIGFAVGDLLYFSIAGLFGYSDPFSDLPVLSVVVVTITMTAPMTAWMLFRRMPRRATIEMSATMPALAVVLVFLGSLGIVPMGSLALLEHALMMPVMLVPMFFRLDLYTGRTGHS
jgi:hypothetical protein